MAGASTEGSRRAWKAVRSPVIEPALKNAHSGCQQCPMQAGVDGRAEGVLVRGVGAEMGGSWMEDGVEVESQLDGVRMHEWARRGWGCWRIVGEGLGAGTVHGGKVGGWPRRHATWLRLE